MTTRLLLPQSIDTDGTDPRAWPYLAYVASNKSLASMPQSLLTRLGSWSSTFVAQRATSAPSAPFPEANLSFWVAVHLPVALRVGTWYLIKVARRQSVPCYVPWPSVCGRPFSLLGVVGVKCNLNRIFQN